MKTKNEKILLMVLFAILLVGGNFYGYNWFSKKQASLRETEADLKDTKALYESVLTQQDDWAKIRIWISDHEPVMSGDDAAEQAKLVESVRTAVLAQHLAINNQKYNPTLSGPAGTRISVSIQIKGSMKDLCDWLADLQKPESFYAVFIGSLKPDQDEKSFDCDIEVARYFKASKGGS